MQDDNNAHSESNQEESIDDVVEDKDPSDKLTPEHPRFKAVLERAKNAEEELTQRDEKLEKLQEQLQDLQEQVKNKPQESYTDAEQEALDKIERAFKQRGYVTNQELEDRERVLRRELSYKELKTKYEKKAGYPQFDPLEVQAYAKKNGYGDNLEAAYKAKHFDAIVKAESSKSTTVPPSSEKPTGGERSVSKGLTLDKINNMSLEEYEKHEKEIDNFMKQQAGLS